VPGGGGWTSLGFTVTNNACDDEVWVVHDGTESYAECIPELTTFVNGSWSFGVNVTWETPWNTESGYKVLETGVVARVFREKSPE
jgi:hypothetical protein